MKSFLVLFLVVVASLGVLGAEKPRVFVSDSHSWQVSGQLGVGVDVGGGSITGGARPQTVEIMKTFAQRCPAVSITMNREKADYVVLLDHEGGKNIALRDNKVAIFNKDGDMIHTSSTRSLGNAVKNACSAIGVLPRK